MATNTTRTDASATHPIAPDPHAVEARSAGRAPSPADDRLLHPLRPVRRRPARAPHSPTGGLGERTTAAGRAASSVRVPLRSGHAPAALRTVPPTVVPDHSGDLLGLPDLSGLRRALRHAWAWIIREVRAAAEIDARVAGRREEDSVAMARAGANPLRLG
ncbi:hypothetical protein [Sinomonas cellulolyticus]|uniref:Uncharacterized protein n=1 Tax=Sinomonas cellulolyticus TaxID=2801916 RepID=A0ABS1K319_9MICC|nr:MULTISPECIES: hypothetical protein [Sinomonas]MBL0706010.1 hypothetical protein [Sinomonas cellulolyticus]